MRQSLHVHSILDDGKSTLEETVLSAIERDLESVGFSGHSYLEGEDWTMNEKELAIYKAEIDRLKREYGERIKIYRGLELDTFSAVPAAGEFEYIIGSCHNIKKDGVMISVDSGRDEVVSAIEKHFDGNALGFARAYFDELLNVKKADILGHFDLCTKFNEDNDLYREEEYFDYALPVLRELNRRGFIFEINTGAIQRGYRSLPYPSQRFLHGLKKENGRITITADCHIAEGIDYWYEEAVLYAKDSGFNAIYVFDGQEFKKEWI